MNKFFIVFALMLLTLAVVGAGCQTDIGTNETDGTETNVSDDTTNESGGAETNVSGGTTGSTDDWCIAGTSWSYEGTTEEGAAEASWTIQGLKTFKGSSYCHVTIETTAEGEAYVIDYYFKETDGEMTDMWMVMKDKSGNLISETHVIGE